MRIGENHAVAAEDETRSLAANDLAFVRIAREFRAKAVEELEERIVGVEARHGVRKILVPEAAAHADIHHGRTVALDDIGKVDHAVRAHARQRRIVPVAGCATMAACTGEMLRDAKCI